MKKKLALLSGLLCLTATMACGSSQTSTPPPTTTTPPAADTYPYNGTWTLVWSDEFNGTDGSAPDPTKWANDIGGGGWGNNELETYTSNLENAHQQGGTLIITAKKDPVTGQYTSARLKTQNLFSQIYGKFEARIKIPAGQGIWPAFWMLGNDIGTAGWPTCGEIDIMENVGKEPNMVHGSMHGPGYSGGSALTGTYTLPSGNFSDDFHTFTVEWEPNVARFYVDGNLYETRTPSDIPGKTWVFGHPFFVIMNVAVGGNWPGNPDGTTVFPQTMQVDYVHVYARK